MAIALSGTLAACGSKESGKSEQAAPVVAAPAAPAAVPAAPLPFACVAMQQRADDGPAQMATFGRPVDVTVDSAGNLYVVDYGNRAIRKITPSGAVTSLVPSATGGDCSGEPARFDTIAAVAVDGAGTLYVSDYTYVLKITPAGTVSPLAGGSSITGPGRADGIGTGAHFANARGIALDSAGNIYVADDSDIRKVTPQGAVTTLAGTIGVLGGNADGTGPAANFYLATDIAVDSAGNAYVADTANNLIRRITPAGVVTTLAGTAHVTGSTDGAGRAASFNLPSGVATDSAGNVYVADTGNNTIRKITPAGVVTTLAGNPRVKGRADGAGAAASFNEPLGIAVDGAGNVYVADASNFLIRKITPAGVVSTIAGSTGGAGSVVEPYPIGKNVYVVTSTATMRSQPAPGSEAIVTLSIGDTLEAASQGYCGHPAPRGGTWVCVGTSMISTMQLKSFYGWVLADQVGSEPPRLDALTAAYDQAPKDDRDARRNLAERAIALDPASAEAETHLVAVLKESGDQAAVAAAEKSFQRYQARQAEGGARAVYAYDGKYLTPVAAAKQGSVTHNGMGAAAGAGQLYYVYANGQKMGTVATYRQFDCSDATYLYCPDSVPVRDIEMSGKPGANVLALQQTIVGYATNFALAPAPDITGEQKNIIGKLMKKAIAESSFPAKMRQEWLKSLNQQVYAHTGRLAGDEKPGNGKLFLVGEQTYSVTYPVPEGVERESDDPDEYHAAFFIAEPQKNGQYAIVKVFDLDIGEGQCSYAASMDIDGDGNDEILAACTAWEQPIKYVVFQRKGGVWEKHD